MSKIAFIGIAAAALFAMGATPQPEPHPLDQPPFVRRHDRPKKEGKAGAKLGKRLKAGKKLWRQ